MSSSNLFGGSTAARVEIIVYEKVSNALDVQRLYTLHENSGDKIFAIDLERIAGKHHLLFGISRALHAEEHGHMRTKSLRLEILYQLTTSTNSNDGGGLFTVSNDTKTLAIIFVDHPRSVLAEEIGGDRIDLDSIEVSASQQDDLMKVYKISKEELMVSNIEDAILSKIALKDL